MGYGEDISTVVNITTPSSESQSPKSTKSQNQNSDKVDSEYSSYTNLDLNNEYEDAYWDGGDARAAAKEYLEYCKENGYTPKFDRFSDHPNYYKLLEDFNSYDCVTEEAAPQGAVTINYAKANGLEDKDAYRARLENAVELYMTEDGVVHQGDRIFSNDDIVKYIQKAQRSYQQIIKNELDAQKAYKDVQAPKYAEVFKQVDDMLDKYANRKALGINKPIVSKTSIPSYFDFAMKDMGLNPSIRMNERFDSGNENIRYSIRTDVLSWDIDWDANNESSIKNQIVSHLDEINRQKIVHSFTFDKTVPYATALNNILKNWGYKVETQKYGTFLFDSKGIANLRRYVNNDAEAAAAIAAPYVVKRGIVISGHKSHNNNGYPSVTFAGRVSINGKVGIVGVAILFGDKNRVHSMRILTPDGKEFSIIKDDTEMAKGGSSNKGVDSPTKSMSSKNYGNTPTAESQYPKSTKNQNQNSDKVDSERFNEKNEDIRYSDKVDDNGYFLSFSDEAALQEYYDTLDEALEYKRGKSNNLAKDNYEYASTYRRKVNEDDVRKVAKNFIGNNLSSADLDEVTRRLSYLYDYILNAGTVDWRNVTEIAGDIARTVMESSSKPGYKDYAEDYGELTAPDLVFGYFGTRERRNPDRQNKKALELAVGSDKLDRLRAKYEATIRTMKDDYQREIKSIKDAAQRDKIAYADERVKRKTAAMNEQKAKEKYRKQIQTLTGKISNKLLENNEVKNHKVPEELKKSVLQFCEIINNAGAFNAKKALRLSKAYRMLSDTLKPDDIEGNLILLLQ